MKMQWKQYEVLQERMHKKFWNRIIKKQHKGRRIDKAFNLSNFINQYILYIGEIGLALLFWCFTVIFGNGNNMPNNINLVYPLNEISTIWCRNEVRSSLSKDCKTTLPIIENANYNNYKNNASYTSIYATLFGGSYLQGWDIDKGSHYGTNIISAKGTPIYSIADGEVSFAGRQSGYGNVVKIQFMYQWEIYFSTYGHMDTIQVRQGQAISKGQKIGTIGNSGGKSNNAHLHFWIHKGQEGKPIYPFLKCKDIVKGEETIINQGLCRDELFTHAIDPIFLLENANARLPHNNEYTHSVEENQSDKEIREQIIQLGKFYLDSPYKMGGTGTKPWESTDCSQFTQVIFNKLGISLERTAMDQFRQFSEGGYRYNDIKKAEKGDLVFFKNTYPTTADREITHVAIYIGENKLLHATTEKVQITAYDNYWKSHFKGVGSFKKLKNNYNPEKAKKSYLALQGENTILQLPAISENFKIAKKEETNLIALQEENKKEELRNEGNKKEEQEKPWQVGNNINNDMIILNDKNLDLVGKEFFKEWDIRIIWPISSVLKKGNEKKFKIQITKKWTNEKYNGILKQPIILVSNNTNLTIEPVAISLIKNGEVEVKIKGNQSGPVYTAINMGINKMGGMNMEIL